MPNQYAFPWGIYIGELSQHDETIPLLLDSQTGGFCLLFDEASELTAFNFMENIALALLETLPLGMLHTDVFNFGKKRFMHLASLQQAKLYDIAYSPNTATSKFNALEEKALYRQHSLLSYEQATLSDYNKNSSISENYHLILLNLEDFPDDMTSHKRIKDFIELAYEAGFYMIAFAHKDILQSEHKATGHILKQFPHLKIENKVFQFDKTLFQYTQLLKTYEFDYINNNKDSIIKALLAKVEQGESSSNERDFLTVPIGTSMDGKSIVQFRLGDLSANYHAFITGMTGSGKTTLLNNIILEIAKNYTAQQIQLYLMDYKDGVEFQVFKDHPNCQKIFLDNEDLQASITLLEEFRDTIRQRATRFKEQQVKNINEYNAQHPKQPLPRIILIIDEVHRLFSGGYQQREHFSTLLTAVMRQGRSFGVHIILSTQTLTGANIDKELMSQIALRISYVLSTQQDSEAIFSYGNTEAVNLEKYQLIYNAKSGNKKANQKSRANPPQDIQKTLEDILFLREENQRLKPEIVQSQAQKSPSTSPKQTTPKKANPPNPKYTTDLEKSLLKRLKEQGIQAKKMPQGETDEIL